MCTMGSPKEALRVGREQHVADSSWSFDLPDKSVQLQLSSVLLAKISPGGVITCTRGLQEVTTGSLSLRIGPEQHFDCRLATLGETSEGTSF